MAQVYRNLILVGLPMSGKTVVGRRVAGRLGLEFRDTDALVVQQSGRSVAQIFRDEGEARFRDLETDVLRAACCLDGAVIATGGGTVLREENRRLMAEAGLVVWLNASPEAAYQRLRESRAGVERPLLTGSDPLVRIEELRVQRAPLYSLADLMVSSDDLALDEVVARIVDGWRAATKGGLRGRAGGFSCAVDTGSVRYPLYVGWGLLAYLGERMKAVGLEGRAFVVTDDAVGSLYGERVTRLLAASGVDPRFRSFPSGEASKTMSTVTGLYDWLVSERVERRDAVVALGGGVVGDCAGFVAATALRGLPLVQVPTSLLAMVDSSIGGKVGVDHPSAKNMIGAFHQPHLVLADVSLLKSLPRRDYVAGWAETIKHALIADVTLVEFLEMNAADLLQLDPLKTVEAIRRSGAIKARVVSADEREAGERTLLNYGHTVGHAIEAAEQYRGLLHGEAIALGMAAAGAIAVALGLLAPEVLARQAELLRRFGLQPEWPAVSLGKVEAAMALDKKTRQKRIRWVLLEEAGRATARDDVPPGLVKQVLKELGVR